MNSLSCLKFRQNVENALLNEINALLENPAAAIRDAQIMLVNDLNVATDPLMKQVLVIIGYQYLIHYKATVMLILWNLVLPYSGIL